MNDSCVASGCQCSEPFGRPACEREGGRTAARIHHADVLHANACAKASSHRLGERLLCGEALGVSRSGGKLAAARLAALNLCEHAILEAFAETVQRVLDALYVAQVRAEADDH